LGRDQPAGKGLYNVRPGSEEAAIALVFPRQGGPGGAWPVRIGALTHSVWDVENILQKYCKQIFALTGDERFPYCLVGSGAAIQIAGRHFVFCCRHQIIGYALDKIAVPLSFAKIMSATTVRAPRVTNDNQDTDTIDVVALEFDVDRYGVANLTSEFFPVEESGLLPTGTAKLPFMVFGYPSSRQLFDEERIGARSVEIKATYDGGSASPHLQRMKKRRTG
jgi:hypothetical protein